MLLLLLLLLPVMLLLLCRCYSSASGCYYCYLSSYRASCNHCYCPLLLLPAIGQKEEKIGSRVTEMGSDIVIVIMLVYFALKVEEPSSLGEYHFFCVLALLCTHFLVNSHSTAK